MKIMSEDVEFSIWKLADAVTERIIDELQAKNRLPAEALIESTFDHVLLEDHDNMFSGFSGTVLFLIECYKNHEVKALSPCNRPIY